MDRFIAWDKNEAHNHRGAAFPTGRLRRLEELLPSRLDRTAETGCGKSTILFSNLSNSHHVFALDDTGEQDSSVLFYRSNPITISANIHEVFGPTQATLFNHQHESSYDCVLIDGPHGWPFPEFEYMLFYPHIRAGGYLILDDVNIPTIGRMGDVIAEDTMWDLVEIIEGTALFRRTDAPVFDPYGDGWWLQNYNRRRVARSRDIFLDDGLHSDQISSLFLNRPIPGRLRARQRLERLAANALAIRSSVQRWWQGRYHGKATSESYSPITVTSMKNPFIKDLKSSIESNLACLKSSTDLVSSSLLADELAAKIIQLQSLYDDELVSIGGYDHCRDYGNWTRQFFGKVLPYPHYPLSTSFDHTSPLGEKFLIAMLTFIVEYEQSLIRQIHSERVPGAVVEFGIFEGYMLGKLIEECEQIGFNPDIYGFDSFEGLSEPSSENDYENWAKGQYACGYEQVAENLRLSERPKLRLVKGFFENSLHTPEANSLHEVAYARIDCDIYSPTVDCLNFLSSRLAHGSILVFDDWVYNIHKGETKAFYEWLPSVPHLQFEFLAHWNWRFYMRVTKA